MPCLYGYPQCSGEGDAEAAIKAIEEMPAMKALIAMAAARDPRPKDRRMYAIAPFGSIKQSVDRNGKITQTCDGYKMWCSRACMKHNGYFQLPNGQLVQPQDAK